MHKTSLPFRIAFLISLFTVTPLHSADESESDETATSEAIESRNQVAIFKVENAESGQVIDRIQLPLLRYTDPARKDNNGTLWAWGTTGRPVAILEMFKQSGRSYWVHWFHRTSDVPLSVTSANRPTWLPKEANVKFQPIPDAPVPAKTKLARNRQLKLLARGFTAHEFWNPGNSRFELRMLAQPVHRYEDTVKNVTDGAIFVIAHGTNPEVILFIEAVEKDGADSLHWQFGVGRTTQAEYHILYNGKEVASGPRVGFRHPTTNPFWLVN